MDQTSILNKISHRIQLEIDRLRYHVSDMDDYYREKERIDSEESDMPFVIVDPKTLDVHKKNLSYLRKIGDLVRFKSWIGEKENESKELSEAILDGKKDFPEQYINEVKYLQEINRLEVFPYRFCEDYYSNYSSLKVYSSDDGKYVLHNSLKLFFPDKFTEKDIKTQYIQLTMEQDAKSPHKYFSEKVDFEKGIFVDVGCAEGIISLDVINRAKEIYLFERSHEWISSLENTFRDYKDKVHIIPYYAGGYDDDEICTLERILSKYHDEEIFIKVDVEGMEIEVLRGSINTVKNNNCKLSCTCYHTNSMEKKLEYFFDSMDYYHEASEGYMLFIHGDMTLKNGMYEKMTYPYFRRGLVRACKKR